MSCASATSRGWPRRAENLVSHHARALRSLGLAESRRDGKMVLYRLTDRGRVLLEAVLGEGVRA
jgi:ArsR family transcriptional regulator, lead/cadmium/zinc/bismuth-responsive transcriptional repressor